MKQQFWTDAQRDFQAASDSFSQAALQFEQAGSVACALPQSQANQAFANALQQGHLALEKGVERVMLAFNEKHHNGAERDGMLRKAYCATAQRSAILEMNTLPWAQITRNFKDLARSGPVSLDPQVVDVLAIAANMLAQKLVPGFLRFLKSPNGRQLT
jgi:hypothetical protein